MSKEARGTPGRYVPKNQPKLDLLTLLKRRGTTLKLLVKEQGFPDHGSLVKWCRHLGVVPPTLEHFEQEFPEQRPTPVQVATSAEQVSVPDEIVDMALTQLDGLSGKKRRPKSKEDPEV